MISGETYAYTTLCSLLKTKFEITFEDCADFLGVDLCYDMAGGTFSVSMKSFTKKFLASCNITAAHPYPIYAPGLTNMNIVRDADAPRAPIPDAAYRQKAGSLNWLVMALRYDLNYSTKELSRVADCPTVDGEYLMGRAINYVSQTTDARLLYDRASLLNYTPPKTRRKPTKLDESLYDLVDKYNIDDGIPQPDDKPLVQDYVYPGH
jgi:hypothetical protein